MLAVQQTVLAVAAVLLSLQQQQQPLELQAVPQDFLASQDQQALAREEVRNGAALVEAESLHQEQFRLLAARHSLLALEEVLPVELHQET